MSGVPRGCPTQQATMVQAGAQGPGMATRVRPQPSRRTERQGETTRQRLRRRIESRHQEKELKQLLQRGPLHKPKQVGRNAL